MTLISVLLAFALHCGHFPPFLPLSHFSMQLRDSVEGQYTITDTCTLYTACMGEGRGWRPEKKGMESGRGKRELRRETVSGTENQSIRCKVQYTCHAHADPRPKRCPHLSEAMRWPPEFDQGSKQMEQHWPWREGRPEGGGGRSAHHRASATCGTLVSLGPSTPNNQERDRSFDRYSSADLRQSQYYTIYIQLYSRRGSASVTIK